MLLMLVLRLNNCIYISWIFQMQKNPLIVNQTYYSYLNLRNHIYKEISNDDQIKLFIAPLVKSGV